MAVVWHDFFAGCLMTIGRRGGGAPQNTVPLPMAIFDPSLNRAEGKFFNATPYLRLQKTENFQFFGK